jgi:hypothetical protein
MRPDLIIACDVIACNWNGNNAGLCSRSRIAETMAYRASGLNLVINGIILWNTVYLSRAVDYVRGQGIVIPDELLDAKASTVVDEKVSPMPFG